MPTRRQSAAAHTRHALAADPRPEPLEEAITLARDAIRGYLEALAKDGRPIPEEHEHPQALTISVAA